MPLVDSAATRQRLGGAEVHAAERRTKGVVTPLMYACQQSRETQVRELLAQKARLLLLLHTRFTHPANHSQPPGSALFSY